MEGGGSWRGGKRIGVGVVVGLVFVVKGGGGWGGKGGGSGHGVVGVWWSKTTVVGWQVGQFGGLDEVAGLISFHFN